MSAPKGSTNNVKDVIYIDVDDEITAIIDKVRGSGKKIVALVLPKRATVLQSIVNIKLLKRAADEAKKHLVLITSESGLMPLAGTVGVHVAKSINSKPEIPAGIDRGDRPETVEESSDGEDQTPLDGAKTVGELSGMAPSNDDHLDDTIELDDDEDAAEESKEGEQPKRSKESKHKQFKIPNFNKFRVMLALIIVGVLALSGVAYAAFVVAPKATITVKTDRTTLSTTTPVTFSTAAGTPLDVANAIVPAVNQQVKKTITQDAPATGQVNNGEKATGTVTLSLTDCSKSSVTVPAGTGISSSGKTFITKSSATMDSVKIGSQCKNADFPSYSTASVSVVAQTGGAAFNIAASSFTVAGYSNVAGQSSAAMTGGTDNIVKIVTQADVDGATQKITAQDTKPIQTELRNALIGRSLFPIDSTFSVGTPDTALSAQVGAAADTVTVTQTITYSMLGAKQDDLQQIIDKTASAKIDTKKQKILDYGLGSATFSIQSNAADSTLISIQTTVSTGAELNTESIKKQVAGKKAGDAQELIKQNPGVTDVTVTYSPFWVGSIPKNTKKITVVIKEQQAAARNADSNP